MGGAYRMELTRLLMEVIKMDQEIKDLKERIVFLEALLELNSHGLEKAIETNRLLIEYLRKDNTNFVQ